MNNATNCAGCMEATHAYCVIVVRDPPLLVCYYISSAASSLRLHLQQAYKSVFTQVNSSELECAAICARRLIGGSAR